ncbi:acetoacetate--CoA ligase [Variovorax sp. WS11]|uniref:acetoacetate--CoA ligase n=1 Tax=Variovorax sp. WS11 TaxID=1105204 RepID=UPI000D0CA14D|nr:acetoacetate--CoA ligase [Variovorax sp. WS11]NDZ12766.1 acetoacetate--CoA ligase [Variovorax sp. WS11]PSL84702.1 acetoacetate--CoA ligase [Variovorax sp. WS11]
MSQVRPRQIWSPHPAEARNSALGQFAKRQGFGIDEYDALWSWSVSRPAEYWSEVWKYAGLQGSTGKGGLTSAEDMATVRFFDDGEVNVAENLLASPGGRVAVIEAGVEGVRRSWTFAELRQHVESVAEWLRSSGVGPGDVVAAVLPNRVEAVVSFLACTAVGAVWTACASELSGDAILDRIGQVEPKILFVCYEYFYNGKKFEFKEVADRLVAALQTLQAVVVVGRDTDVQLKASDGCNVEHLRYCTVAERAGHFEWKRFAFNSPALIMYTSGTTGKPKAMVHSGGGVLLKLTSEHAFHVGAGEGDVMFWYSNIGWMMFLWLAFALVRGTAIVLYEDAAIPNGADGPDLGTLWRIAEAAGVTVMGVSPSYISAMADGGYSPKDSHKLGRLHTILAAGAPVSAEQFEWIHSNVSALARFSPISGGTELMSAFVGGSPLHSVRAGEMSCRCLGMAVNVFDEHGVPVVGRKGELVCTEPFPSMPLTFVGANGNARYRAAYFEHFPKVWTHGDLAELTISGGIVIYGRSDTTLNPGGVRIGTAEIYRPLADIGAVEAAVVFGRPVKNTEEIVLCVKLSDGRHLDKELAAEIRAALRKKASPRHVPHAIYQVDAVPLTHNGKPIEAAAKAAATSADISRFTALCNPECLGQFSNLREADAL